MVRTTRRQIKEDKLVTTTAKISLFLSEHWKKIVSVIAGVAVIVAALLAYHTYKTSKDEKASLNLDEARTLFGEAESASESDGKTDSVIEKYEKAKIQFQAVAQKGGNRYTVSEALFYLAKCAYQLGEYKDAISGFQKVLDQYPKSMFALYALKGIGQSYEQLGDDESLKKAIQHYDELTRQPESYITLSAFIDKGRCYEKLKEWDQSIAAYQIIVDRFKRNVEAAIQAKSLDCVKNAKDVISKYEAALGKNPTSSDLAKQVGEKTAQKQWFEVLKIYDKAIFSQKERWNEQKVAGEYNQLLEDASTALESYETLSKDLIENINAGRKHEERGEWVSALTYYRRALKTFDFLPGTDLYESAQFRINLINSTQKQV